MLSNGAPIKIIEDIPENTMKVAFKQYFEFFKSGEDSPYPLNCAEPFVWIRRAYDFATKKTSRN